MSNPSDVDRERMAELDALVAAIGTADVETLLELRQFLLSSMFPSMTTSVRELVLPMFALMTLEARWIGQGLPRLGEARRQGDADPAAWRPALGAANAAGSPSEVMCPRC